MELTPATRKIVDEVNAGSERLETPLGNGIMAWRRWGKGEPVMLLHGGSGSWLHWLRTIPALSRTRTVWVPDMPGFGETAVPPEPWNRETYAVLVADAMSHLGLDAHGLDVVGFSAGAGIAVRLATDLNGRFRHLVLSGAGFIVDPVRTPRNLKSARRLTDPAERRRAFVHNVKEMMLFHTAETDELGVELYEYDSMRRSLPRHSFSNAAAIRAELPGLRLKGRLTVVAGADDQVIGHSAEEHAQALKELRPEAEYVAIPRAGHWVMHEGAEKYNEAVLRALGV